MEASLRHDVLKAYPDVVEINEIAAQVARDGAASMVTGLSVTNQKTVRMLVARGLDQGWSDATLRARIAQVAGLGPRDAAAVERFRARMLASGMSPGKADQRANAYAKRLVKARAQVIGDHETRKALQEAQRLLWQKQQASGLLSSYAVRITRVHKDERTCPICSPLNGRRNSLKNTNNGPPFHPNCRCYEELSDQGIEKHEPRDGDSDGFVFDNTPRQRSAVPDTPSGLRPDIREDLEGDDWAGHYLTVRVGFAEGLLDCARRYPKVAAHIRGVRAGGGHVASTEYTPDGTIIKMDPDAMLNEFARMRTNFTRADYVPPNLAIQFEHHEYQAGDVDEYGDVSPDMQALAYAVAVHEFGHVAQMHFAAAVNDVDTTWAQFGDTTEWDKFVPVVSAYAQTNLREQFAEWFTAEYFKVRNNTSESLRKALNAALNRTVVISRGTVVAKVWKADEHDDFQGSVVEDLVWADAMHSAGWKVSKDEPKDGDGDGFVYDGTPKMRPALPRERVRPRKHGVGRAKDHAHRNMALREAEVVFADKIENRPRKSLPDQHMVNAGAEQAAIDQAAAKDMKIHVNEVLNEAMWGQIAHDPALRDWVTANAASVNYPNQWGSGASSFGILRGIWDAYTEKTGSHRLMVAHRLHEAALRKVRILEGDLYEVQSDPHSSIAAREHVRNELNRAKNEVQEALQKVQDAQGNLDPESSDDWHSIHVKSFVLDYMQENAMLPGVENPQRLLELSDEEYDDAIYRRLRLADEVRTTIDAWAGTSLDSSTRSIALQYAVAERFDLPEQWAAIEDHLRFDGKTIQMAKDHYEQNKPFIDTIVEAMYQHTQQDLERRGVTEITVYRGMGLPTDAIDHAVHSNEQEVPFGFNPLTSWSHSESEAESFAMDSAGRVFTVTVPRENVFSAAVFGLGCLNEREYVLVGGHYEVLVRWSKYAIYHHEAPDMSKPQVPPPDEEDFGFLPEEQPPTAEEQALMDLLKPYYGPVGKSGKVMNLDLMDPHGDAMKAWDIETYVGPFPEYHLIDQMKNPDERPRDTAKRILSWQSAQHGMPTNLRLRLQRVAAGLPPKQ